MRILVLGAGAVGLSVAAQLSAVADVRAVCRKRHAEAVRERGFRMTGIWGGRTVSFSCGEDLPRQEEFDYVIVTAKSTATEDICRQFADVIRDRETVSLQNGIGNEEIIARYTDRIIGGMIITGFEWRGDAAVHVSVEAAPMRLGRYPEGMDEQVMRLVGLFRGAGVNAEASSLIRSDIWSKTLYNSALNPLGAIMDVPYGALSDPHAWRIIERIVEEAYRVAEAEGVVLPWAAPGDYLLHLQSAQLPATAAHHSSMLQDLRQRRKTEIDFLNGAIVALGGRHGMNLPYNACISDLIRFRERLASGGG
ncbi:MAG: 2-dehydropantoate 2-reductase [Methanomicrobiaceae archaeon]|uniref:2-dehydropantoate 2-reductase n=1 Tax=hydrocarbon metagenome TaxID=938273 RepID=A0A0W8FG11_9ZZZZ|nr:2-dehydropantoate 2-reductase [Methanomicrobiaceae archaeon]MDD5419312.1 2-dehydropantoate 2-reductase [Methanomicrobiaceae archaeon]